jgi:hypothetical protein
MSIQGNSVWRADSPSAYLAKKLARPLPTTDGRTLRTVLDARAYMVSLLKHTTVITTFAAKAEGLLTFSAASAAEPFQRGRSILFQLLRHCEMPLQIGQCFRRPLLEFRIGTTVGVSREQRNRILMPFDLHLVIALVEVLAALRL